MTSRSSTLVISSLFVSAFFIMAFIISFLFFNHAIAEPSNEQMPPLAKMSLELDVTPNHLLMCMEEGKPASLGAKPDKAAMLTCLQNANPAITSDKLDEVMKKNMPAPGSQPEQ
ncbi:hypothetical protein [Shewanella surugensis]|uniref:Uncharacterized protein n=1 Tax=Shewanella surugensis TaxID=212020 RepID=A0ABT0LB85_9GAMM|nr:hypothetical protein [Shewanella surugensis]MCL1124630.1 hypothetical protein [Shewanella surugensis]